MKYLVVLINRESERLFRRKMMEELVKIAESFLICAWRQTGEHGSNYAQGRINFELTTKFK